MPPKVEHNPVRYLFDLRRYLQFGLIFYLAASSASAAPPVRGNWEGTIDLGAAKLAVVVHLDSDKLGWSGRIDIPQQGGIGLSLEYVEMTGNSISFQISEIQGSPHFVGIITENTMAGTFFQHGHEFPFRLQRTETQTSTPQYRRPQSPQKPFPYTVRQVRFPSTNHILAGTLTLPAGEGLHPAIVLVTGSGPQNRDMRIFGHRPFAVWADRLSRSGVAVLRYDDRGVGESEGRFTGATTTDFANDASAALRFLSSLAEVGNKPVGILGHSEGGLVASKLLARENGPAFAVLLASPGVPGDEVILRQVTLMLETNGASDSEVRKTTDLQKQLLDIATQNLPAETIREQLTRHVLEVVQEEGGDPHDPNILRKAEEAAQLATPWYREILRYDPAPDLHRNGTPVFALNGTLDLQVDPEQNLSAIKKALEQAVVDAGAPIPEIRLYDGLNHFLQPAKTGAIDEYSEIEVTVSEEVLEHVVDWVQSVVEIPTSETLSVPPISASGTLRTEEDSVKSEFAPAINSRRSDPGDLCPTGDKIWNWSR